jgi:hypothetical protein
MLERLLTSVPALSFPFFRPYRVGLVNPTHNLIKANFNYYFDRFFIIKLHLLHYLR